MLLLARIGRLFGGDSFSWEAHFQRALFLLEHEKLHGGSCSILEDDFGMGDVKVADISMRGASYCRTPMLSMRRID